VDGATAAVSGDLRVGVAFKGIRIESRTASLGSINFEDRGVVFHPFYDSGVHTFTRPGVQPLSPAISTLRVGYATNFAGMFMTASAGGGWMWNADEPVLVASSGFGFGRTFRVGLEGEVTGYRVPFHTVTAEFRQGLLFREMERTETHDWRTGHIIKLYIELAPFRVD
jgi:hypothetical protein